MNERMKKRNIERFDNEVGNGLGCNEEGIRDRLGIDKGDSQVGGAQDDGS